MKKIAVAVLVLLLGLLLFPLVILTAVSLMPLDTANALLSGTQVPPAFSLSQFQDVFVNKLYGPMFLNSVKLTVSSVLFHLPVSFFAAVMLWRAKGRMKKIAAACYVAALLLPFQSTMLPAYQIFRALRLENSLWSITLLAVFAPLGPLMMSAWLKLVPDDCWDAALLETNSLAAMMTSVLLPQMQPAFLILGFVTAAEVWNMTEQPLILLQRMDARPLSALYNNTQRGGDSLAFAGSLLYLLPCMVLVLVLLMASAQKRFSLFSALKMESNAI